MFVFLFYVQMFSLLIVVLMPLHEGNTVTLPLRTVHTVLQVAQTSPVQTCLHCKMRAKEGGVFKMEIIILKIFSLSF